MLILGLVSSCELNDTVEVKMNISLSCQFNLAITAILGGSAPSVQMS